MEVSPSVLWQILAKSILEFQENRESYVSYEGNEVRTILERRRKNIPGRGQVRRCRIQRMVQSGNSVSRACYRRKRTNNFSFKETEQN